MMMTKTTYTVVQKSKPATNFVQMLHQTLTDFKNSFINILAANLQYNVL